MTRGICIRITTLSSETDKACLAAGNGRLIRQKKTRPRRAAALLTADGYSFASVSNYNIGGTISWFRFQRQSSFETDDSNEIP